MRSHYVHQCNNPNIEEKEEEKKEEYNKKKKRKTTTTIVTSIIIKTIKYLLFYCMEGVYLFTSIK